MALRALGVESRTVQFDGASQPLLLERSRGMSAVSNGATRLPRASLHSLPCGASHVWGWSGKILTRLCTPVYMGVGWMDMTCMQINSSTSAPSCSFRTWLHSLHLAVLRATCPFARRCGVPCSCATSSRRFRSRRPWSSGSAGGQGRVLDQRQGHHRHRPRHCQ